MSRAALVLPWIVVTLVVAMVLASLWRLNNTVNLVVAEQTKVNSALKKLKVMCVDVNSGSVSSHLVDSGHELHELQNRPNGVPRAIIAAATGAPGGAADASQRDEVIQATAAPISPGESAPPSIERYKRLPRVAIVTLNAQGELSTPAPQDRMLRRRRQYGAAVSGSAQRATWMYKMSFHNKFAYAKKWGYDLIVEDNEIVDKTRDVAWSKIPIWKKWLSKYQWLMWMDMDAFFMRFDLDLTRFLDDRYDVVIAKDFNGINMGVMFVRNSPKTFEILQRMWDAPRAWWYPWEEQSALMAMLDPRKNTRDAAQLQRHFLHPPQRDFNSYPGDFSYGNAMSMYKDGDFIAHFPNCKAFGHCQQTISRFYRRSCDQNDVKEMAADPPPRYYPGDKFDIYDASRFE